MKKTFVYKTKGTCSREIHVVLDGDIIESVEFVGGCNGNTKGISALVKGQNIDDTINRVKGVTCGFKPTSCPDQLALALMAVGAFLAANDEPLFKRKSKK